MPAIASPQKTKLEQRLVGGLALLFVGVLVLGPAKAFFLPRKSVSAAVAAGASAPGTLPSLIQRYHERLALASEPAPVIVARKPLLVAYLAQELRDPMVTYLPQQVIAAPSTVPPGASAFSATSSRASAPPALAVQGVVWGGAQPQALIGGKFYRLGDQVLGHPILAIERLGVTIEHEGKPVTYGIPLSGESAARSRMR
jgi:hypothetical protein